LLLSGHTKQPDAYPLNAPGARQRQPERHAVHDPTCRLVRNPDRRVHAIDMLQSAIPKVQAHTDHASRISKAEAHTMYGQIQRLRL